MLSCKIVKHNICSVGPRRLQSGGPNEKDIVHWVPYWSPLGMEVIRFSCQREPMNEPIVGGQTGRKGFGVHCTKYSKEELCSILFGDTMVPNIE